MHVNTHDTTYENATTTMTTATTSPGSAFKSRRSCDDDQRWSTWSSVEKGAHGPEPGPTG